ncbi:MAG TPA: SRPBCC family protein [Polyangiales bacterium]
MVSAAPLFRAVSRVVIVAVVLAGVTPSAHAGSGISVSAAVRAGGMDSNLAPAPGMNVQWGRAVAIIDAPVADVTAIVQNYAGYQTFLPNFEASRVLSQRDTSALVYVQLSVLNGARTLWAELKLRAHEGEGGTRVVEAKMMKGNVSHFEAVWEVTALDAQHTLVAFQILVDPSLPLPSSMLSEENAKSARKTLRALRALVATRKPSAA